MYRCERERNGNPLQYSCLENPMGSQRDATEQLNYDNIGVWELDHKESWARKELMLLNCGVRETFESPLDSRETKPVKPKRNQSWIFIVKTDAEAELPIIWPPDAKNWIIVKDPDAGKDWKHEEKGTMEDEMVGWHHWLNGHEFEQAPGVGDGQGSLACCSSWGRKELDITEWLNWKFYYFNLYHHLFTQLSWWLRQ